MAFPTTPILDNFNRADGGLGANWTYMDFGGAGGGPAIISNQVGPDAAGDFALMIYNASTYGPDVEAYIDVPTKISSGTEVNTIGFYTSSGSFATLDGYYVSPPEAAGTSWLIARRDDGAATQLGATFTQSFANGDAFGMARIGNDIEAWHRTGGVWSLLATRTDSTYVGAGKLAFSASDNSGGAYRLDNFGGGVADATVKQRTAPIYQVGAGGYVGHTYV